MRERLCGERWWIVNMAACGVGGVFMILMGLMWLVCGKISERVGGVL
jgi:biotin transporter BioY